MKKNNNLHAARKAKNDEFVFIPDFPGYGISRQGEVMNFATGKVLKGIVLQTGYIRVVLPPRRQMLVHRLVAEVFLDNPNNFDIVHHIDENPANNNVDNLEWTSHKQNIRYSCAGHRSYLHKSQEYYETSGCTRADFKRICSHNGWNYDDFDETDTGLKRHSNRKYTYKKSKR